MLFNGIVGLEETEDEQEYDNMTDNESLPDLEDLVAPQTPEDYQNFINRIRAMEDEAVERTTIQRHSY